MMNLDSYIWFGSNVILFIFTYFLIPETRDRTLEEIHEMFQAKLPARKFKGYVCVSTGAIGRGAAHKETELEDAVHVEDSSKLETEDNSPTKNH